MKTKNTKDQKKRSPLTLRERIDIESMYRYGKSMGHIAKKVERNKSTISREIDGIPRTGIGKYDADISHRRALDRIKNRGNTPILDKNEKLKEYVIEKLKLGWSCEQISIRLPSEYLKDKGMRISYEAIYQYIYGQIHRKGNGKVKKNCQDLRPCLPRRHKRRAKKGFRKAQKVEKQASLPSIEDRPKEVEKRKRVGDWEDDLIVSRQSKPCVKSINERKTGIVFFGKTIDGTAKESDKVLFEKLNKIPNKYKKTLTRDRGSENKDFKNVEKELKLSVYFAHAYSSYERGSNENANGLLRRYFPKKTDWSKISNEDISKVEYLINTRPRKRFDGLTPEEMFYKGKRGQEPLFMI